MVKIFLIILMSVFFANKSYAASSNLFFTTAQFITYCKSDNMYEQGVCDGYIISVSDVLYTLDKRTVQVCIPENTSIKSIRLSVIDFIIDNAQLMSTEANKMIGQFFVNSFPCKKLD